MGIWMVIIRHPDICYAISSLSRFGACPRQGHLDLMQYVYGFLKKFDTRCIAVDSSDIDIGKLSCSTTLRADFLDEYRDAFEEIDPKFPKARGRELQTTLIVDSDHNHDKRTRRSITVLIVYVRSTPTIYYSKRQRAIATSFYKFSLTQRRVCD